MDYSQEIRSLFADIPCRTITLALNDFIDILGGKWRFPIIFSLYFGARRFNDLKRQLIPITARALTQNLTDLEMNLLVRYNSESREYFLTEYAQSLKPIISLLHEMEAINCNGEMSIDERQRFLVEAIHALFRLIGGKWRMQVMGYLLFQESRFGDMKVSITGISSKELSKNLTDLIGAGIVKKKTGEESRAIYSLTDRGKSFELLIAKIVQWTLSHREQLRNTLLENGINQQS